MQVPTGGIVRELRSSSRTGDFLIRRNSGTDSIVWMREEIYSRLYIFCVSDDSPLHERLTPERDFRGFILRDTPDGRNFREDCLFQNNLPHMRRKKERRKMSTETKTTVQSQTKERFGVRALVNIGMLAAIAVILMLFEIPLPFAPSFYEIDFSEVPVMVGCFAMGPFAGALIEFVKILLNFVFTGTDTAGVGELANFIIGCSLCVPAGLIYRRKRTRTTALIGMAAGTVTMTAIGCAVNAFVLLPTYATAFGMPIDALVEMGTAVNPAINSLTTFVFFAVAPFNILKGVLVSAIVFLIYKKISPIFRMRLS